MSIHATSAMANSVGNRPRALNCMGRWLVSGALVGLVASTMAPAAGLAQGLSPTSVSGYRVGMVTAVQGQTLTIGGSAYQLAPDVVILDPEEKVLEPADIHVNAEARFLVKREQPNRIIRMILVVPQ